MSKKCLILIDSFKGSKNASSKELGKFLSAFLSESTYLPISDGGDGFLDFIDAIKSSKKIQIKTFSPLKDEININILLPRSFFRPLFWRPLLKRSLGQLQIGRPQWQLSWRTLPYP